ncbi:MAG: FAD-dependent oxidoreductase [Chloroflexi bacterium]|nr:FAD-dependent oxidoreductase [Chloroflexota bacterium]
MWQFETRLSEVIQRTPAIKTFRFYTNDRNVRYQAGQYFFVTIRIGNSEAVHHFTISSSPTEKGYLDFTKRITASEYSVALDAMKPGDWVRLRGAEGDFILPRKPGKLAFISGGIGITPLRSMLQYICDLKLDYDVVLIYGNNNWEDIAFREELNGMAAARPNIRVEYVLSGPDFPLGWKGKRGFISKEIVTELIPDYKERIFYTSGPMKMVFSLEEQLKSLKIPTKQIKRDYFPGYD